MSINSRIICILCLLYHVSTVKTVNLLKEHTNWEFNNEISECPVDGISQDVVSDHNGKEILEVTVGKVKRDCILALFAIPRANAFECPRSISSKNKNLRQYIGIKDLTANSSFHRYVYNTIFTGCYYTVIINSTYANFMVGPKFVRTSYEFKDLMKLTVYNEKTKPDDGPDSPKILKNSVKVPLNCIQIAAKLYVWNGKIKNGMDQDEALICEIMKDTANKKQHCIIDSNGHKQCLESKLTAMPTIEVTGPTTATTTGEWTVDLSWENLSHGASAYYIQYEPLIHGCDAYLKNNRLMSDVNTWLPGDIGVLDKRGTVTANNAGRAAVENFGFDWSTVAVALGILIGAVIVLYWIRKYRKVLFGEFGKRKNSVTEEEPPQQIIDKESNKILLVYKDGPTSLMNEINRMKHYLEENCPSCQIHDVYATNEWDRLRNLGVAGWVQELLKDGGKIVWVDTPEFRSCLNDERKQYTVGDFRADVVPYTVSVGIDSYQNPATQYRRHFVVRVKGFEVEDGDEDPLRVVTPHARYCIPDHLFLLCGQLQAPPTIV